MFLNVKTIVLLWWQSAVYDPGIILRTAETLSPVPPRLPSSSESDDPESSRRDERLNQRRLTYRQPNTIRQEWIPQCAAAWAHYASHAQKQQMKDKRGEEQE